MSATTHVVIRNHLSVDHGRRHVLDGLHPDRGVRRDVVALLVLGVLGAVVCVASTGWIAVLAAVAALATPAMGKVALAISGSNAEHRDRPPGRSD